ncbi:hypothetical protein GCM10018785_50240 [Streptomyces longispororuber]|uniref:Uncharacterized protein n=1 Tax=Streptomyces longispororuber TaxID=68230 RepID=A0A918ZYZ1_9ACTN|nr:hypothetical protein GCM10018785_50240 [Streptomyces longispororuber]
MTPISACRASAAPTASAVLAVSTASAALAVSTVFAVLTVLTVFVMARTLAAWTYRAHTAYSARTAHVQSTHPARAYSPRARRRPRRPVTAGPSKERGASVARRQPGGPLRAGRCYAAEELDAAALLDVLESDEDEDDEEDDEEESDEEDDFEDDDAGELLDDEPRLSLR